MMSSVQPRGFLIYGVLCLLIVTVTKVQELFPFLTPLQLGKLSILLTLVLFMASPRPAAQVRLLQIPQIRIVLAIYALCLFSVPFSVYKGQSFDMAVEKFPIVLLFFYMLIYAVNSFIDLQKVLWTFLFGAVVLASFTIIIDTGGRVAAGSTYDPNDIALLFVISLPIVYFFAGAQKGKNKLFLFGILLALLFALVRTASRGGFIGLSTVTLFILFMDRYRPLKIKLIMMAILVFSFVQFAPESYWERIQTIFAYEQDYNLTAESGRKALWLRGLQLMMENPITGVGAGAIVTGIGYSYGEAGGKWLTVHNAFIQVGAELGVGGLVLFISLILTSIINLRRMRVRYAQGTTELHDNLWLMSALEVSLWGFCISSMFLSSAYFTMFYFLIALCCILRKLEMMGAAADYSGEGGVLLPQVEGRQ